MTAPANSPWVQVPRASSHARCRLVCLPHAGAGASTYFGWGRLLEADGIEARAVQYPGRETRLAEATIADGPAMLQALAEAWPAISGSGPCALYGHSMGAMLGYELAVELARRGAPHQPRHLFLSACNPPHLPLRVPRLHELPDAEMFAALQKRYGNLPAELLADRTFLELIAPAIRADFAIVSNYTWAGHAPLEVPLTILGGTEDPETTPAELAEWSRHTRASCRVQLLPGDHFFNQKRRAEVLEVIKRELTNES